MNPPTSSEPAFLSRLLSPITEVRPGEAVTALIMTANVFLLLTAYYVLKPLREDLILATGSGAEYKSYMSGAIAVLLFVLVPLYGKLVDKLPRAKLVIGVSLGFALQLVLFYVLLAVPTLRTRLGLVFFAWIGIFNVMLVAQFWAYANDIYTKEQGDRLFPMIAVGASVGAAVGSKLAKLLIDGLGESSMLVVAACLLVICAGLFFIVERRERNDESPASTPKAQPEEEPQAAASDKHGGFALILKNRYLLWIALFALVYNWVNSNGEYMLSKLIKDDAVAAVKHGQASDVGHAIGAAYADFFFYVNVAGVVLQTFLVSRLVRWLKLPTAFLFLPVIALGNAFIFAFVPITWLAKTGKTAENATDYSLNNTLKQMLWLVTSAEMKYKAKQVTDTFCVRMGDVCSALSVFCAVDLLGSSVQRFAWISLALSGAWLLLAVAIGHRYRRLEQQQEALTS